MTFVYESVEISSFLMFMNSRLLLAFIQTFHSDKILKITLFLCIHALLEGILPIHGHVARGWNTTITQSRFWSPRSLNYSAG